MVDKFINGYPQSSLAIFTEVLKGCLWWQVTVFIKFFFESFCNLRFGLLACWTEPNGQLGDGPVI